MRPTHRLLHDHRKRNITSPNVYHISSYCFKSGKTIEEGRDIATCYRFLRHCQNFQMSLNIYESKIHLRNLRMPNLDTGESLSLNILWSHGRRESRVSATLVSYFGSLDSPLPFWSPYQQLLTSNVRIYIILQHHPNLMHSQLLIVLALLQEL